MKKSKRAILFNTILRFNQDKYKFFFIPILLFCFLAFSPFSFFAFGSYSGYISSLQSIGVSSQFIQDNKPLYRNDVVRLLSTISCTDCLHPPQSLIDKYNSSWRTSFIKQPGNNFDDVIRNNYIRNGENYYYCTALAADQDVINGYPRDISPFCPGKFCGANLVKQGETIAIIYNLKKQQLTKAYQINRKTVKTRLSQQNPNSPAFKNFNLIDLANINGGILKCNNQENCDITTAAEMDSYAKYCTRNLSACNMINFKYLKQGQRPVAEINVLMKEGVISVREADQIKPYDLATTQQLINYLYRLNQSVSCSFDLDYDKDGIKNHQDNCPTNYNPSQLNTDNDQYGDVCDEDIDGDGLLNPPGINDIGFINPKYYLNKQSSPVLALAIKHEAQTYTFVETDFEALYSGTVNSLMREFGDNKQGQGIRVGHTYETVGQKVVTLIANNSLSASATINVLNATSIQILKTLGIQANKLSANIDEAIDFQALTTGGVRSVQWQFGDGSRGTGFNVKHRFAKPGIYTVYALGDNQLKAWVVVNINHNQNLQKDPNLRISCSIIENKNNGTSNKSQFTCKASTSGYIADIQWEYCDGGTGAGKQITHTLDSSRQSCLVTAIGDKQYLDQDIVDFDTQDIYDNCPTHYNAKQTDSNKNGLGDECEKPNTGGNGLNIESYASSLTAPATVSFVPIFSGYNCLTGNTRNLGNGQTAATTKASTIYTKGGLYEIGLVDCKGNTAFTSVAISGTGSSNIGLQITPNPLSGTEGFKTKITPNIQGKCDTISRSTDKSTQATQTTQGTQPVTLVINGKGAHSISAYCYIGTTIKAVAQANVGVDNGTTKSIGSRLEADTLSPFVGQPVKLKTTVQGFDAKQIQSVAWDFGDGTNLGGKSLNTIHIYLKAGVTIIKEIITLTDGQVLTNIIQLNVLEKKDDGGFLANLKINPLIGTTNQAFLLQLIPNFPDKIKSLTRFYGDGQTKQSEPNGLKQLHTYAKAGVYMVGVLVNLIDGSQPSYGGQITVNSVDPCLKLIGKGQSEYKCDMDKDKTPDICDDDIEGDGYTNPVGIILYENPDCSIKDNLNTPLLEQYTNHANNDPSIDNCPIVTNPGQDNTDNDQYGNVCDAEPNIPNTTNNTDNDNDGIPNHLDNLPTVPSGPLSASNTAASIPSSTIASTCTTCPCGFTQMLSPIAQGDIIYAEMGYEGGSIKSNFFPVK